MTQIRFTKQSAGFVKDYNNPIDTTNKSSVSGVKNNVRSLTATTTGNETLLKAIGITVKADNKLSIDEDTFKKADMSKVEALFKGKYLLWISGGAQNIFDRLLCRQRSRYL